MKKGILFLLILFTTLSLNAQTVLSAGDIAIVGINCDDPDDFAFVLLKDISTSTVINFTDNGWLAIGAFRTGEGIIAYTAPFNQSAGTVITYSVYASNFASVSGSFSLATGGDQIIAFQGDITSPTVLYALNDDGSGIWQSDATSSNNSALPTGLINGTSAVALNEIDNAYYSSGINQDLNALVLAISNNANWTGDDVNRYDLSTIIPNPLPVELTSFLAMVVDSKVKLKWTTATELNNFGFELQRKAHTSTSLSATDWEKIGFVNGNGNSNSPKSYNFTDNDVTFGKYNYRLKQIDNDGQFEYSKTVEVDLGNPTNYELNQNYPNPFNPTTTISFKLPEASQVKLTVYNILGQEVKVLIDEFKEAGLHTINFKAEDLNSGLYIYKLQAGSFTQTRKMTLLK